ncbi:MAG: EAL domain-containing protein [Idiomarina sp.]|nr:EAL domain-containing protein [Idiomarina sp.]
MTGRRTTTQGVYFNELMHTMERLADVGGWCLDVSEQTLFWTDQTKEIFGCKQTPPVEDVFAMYEENSRKQLQLMLQACEERGQGFSLDAQIVTPTGETRWVALMGEAKITDGVIRYVFGAVQNITRKKRRFEELKSQREQLDITLNNLLDGVVLIDRQGIIRSFSKPAEAMFGYRSAEVLGRNIRMLMPEPYAREHDGYMQNYHETGERKIIGIGREVEAKRKDGSVFPIDLAVTQTDFQSERQYIGTIRDISRQREAARRIEMLSYYDETTKLPNRYKFMSQLTELLGAKQRVGVLAINLDFFARINTVHGFEAGDQVLRVISHRVGEILPEGFVLAKDIGDRFWIAGILDSLATFYELAAKVLAIVRQPIQCQEQTYFLTASIGLVSAPETAASSELMAHAETALYTAKEEGRDQFSVYEDVMTAHVIDDYRMEVGLRKALIDGELECWLQSKVDAQHKVIGAEALVRWRRENGAIVSPARFIPLAERLGIIVDIGRFMLCAVADLLARLQQQGVLSAAFRIAVNVSPKQFLQPDFVTQVQSIFGQRNVPLSAVTLEITENLLLGNESLIRDRMLELTSQGVEFSIDDFGTGYSNLKRLQSLPLAELKVDREFILGVGQGKHQEALLETILRLAQGMQMNTVAEGIETPEQATFVLSQGCQQLQGYLFSKPTPVNEWFEEFVMCKQ